MTEEVQNQAQTPPQEQPQQPQEQGADLNISDLQALKNIIDIASTRGAFKAPELAAVGAVYNKLTNFLNTVAKGQ